MSPIQPVKTKTIAACLVAALAAVSQSLAAASEPRSPPLAKELTTLMAERQLTTMAAPDPETPGRFVAVMAFPDVQLLVMAAQHATPDYVQSLIAHGRFDDVYTALQQGLPQSKLFFQDLGCDGLHRTKEQTPDVMYERGADQTLFDGNWRARGIAESAYRKKLDAAEEEYGRMLSLLLEALRAKP
jgi:hypothetical protein